MPLLMAQAVRSPMSDIAVTRIPLLIRPIFSLPTLAQAASDSLNADPTALVTDENGNSWRGVESWLVDRGQATVLCQMRGGLSVTLAVAPLGDAHLLPLAGSPLSVDFVYTPATPAGAEPRRHPLQVDFDASNRLKLVLPFPDTADGHALYDEIVGAMTDPATSPAAEVSYTQHYMVQPPAHWPTIFHGPIILDEKAATSPAAGLAAERMDLRTARVERVQPDLAARRIDPREMRIDPNREVEVFNPGGFTGPLQTPDPVAATLARSFRIPLDRHRNDTAVFPDLPLVQQGGWRQVPGRGPGQAPLFFRDADVDSFFYLPTRFALGFYSSTDGADVRPPMRAELYREAGTGAYRVKATLVAVPQIDDDDREALRGYLRTSVLLGTSPYVQLEPAAGVAVRFVGDWSAAGPQATLPASIQLHPDDVVADQRLILPFDMAAADYPIFCELLRHGLHGQVQLASNEQLGGGIQSVVDVRLRFEEVLTNALSIDREKLTSPALALTNLLDLPVHLAGADVVLLDRGPVTNIIFGVEPHNGLLSDQALDAKGMVSADITPTSTSWDLAIAVLGKAQVDGGTADDWFARVHQDPSLGTESFQVNVSLVVGAGVERAQLFELRLFRDGEAAPRNLWNLVAPSPAPLAVAVERTLAELAGQGGQAATFSLELDTLYKDGTASLVQRVAVDPAVANLALVALLEAPGIGYRIAADDGTTQTLADRAAAAALVDQLRTQGRHWQIAAVQPAPPAGSGTDGGTGAGTGTTGTGGTSTTTGDGGTAPAAGPAVSVVTDLLADRFRSGGLTQVFLVLRAAAADAPESTLIFDPQHAGAQSWRPAGGTIPPFHYKVTYLYTGGVFRQTEATASDLVLVLDPPAVS